MRALKTMPISFPGLFGDWEFNPDPVALDIGHGVYWYGIILAIGMLAGLYLALKQAKRFGIKEDDVTDVTLWAIPSCIVGARTYYVLFYLDLYRRADGSLDIPAMFRLWDGGLAIYGAVIAGALVLFLFARAKKIPVAALMDLGVMGLILGQIIGRWANFINREAFGAETTSFLRMGLLNRLTGEVTYYHPTFLYESLWNACGFVLLHFLSKRRKYDGQIALCYVAWYGLGRAMIEGLRTDSLYLGPIRVSQLLAAASCVVAVTVLIVMAFKKHDPEKLFVNVVAKRNAPTEPVEAEEAAEEE